MSAELIERPPQGVNFVGDVPIHGGTRTQYGDAGAPCRCTTVTSGDVVSADGRDQKRQNDAPARIVQGAALVLQTASRLVVLAEQLDLYLHGKRPREKADNGLRGATVNGTGSLVMRAEKVASETLLARIRGEQE